MSLTLCAFTRNLLTAPAAAAASLPLLAGRAHEAGLTTVPPHAMVQIGRFKVPVLTNGQFGMPFPWLGRIGHDADTLAWIPENWAFAD